MEEHIRQGLAALHAGDLMSAETHYRKALAFDPGDEKVNYLLGALFLRRREPAQAEAYFVRALARNGRNTNLLYNYAVLLLELQRPAEALRQADRALLLQPDHAKALAARGQALMTLSRPAEAAQAFGRAIAQGHDGAQIRYQKAFAELTAQNWAAAEASFAHALALAPGMVDAVNNRGVALMALGRNAEAQACFEQAIGIEPHNPQFHVNLGAALQRMDRQREAIAAYDRALALDPGLPLVRGVRLMAKQLLCDWRDFSADCADLVDRLSRGETASAPFNLLAIPSGAKVQLAAARLASLQYPPQPPLAQRPHAPRGKIRIAYLSSDFRQHPIGFLMAGMFEAHDRTAFETFAISTAADDGSPIRRRLAASFDHFIDVTAMKDDAAAAAIHAAGIDILIDMNGHTEGARPGILSFRPAPLQVLFMGYAGTMGAPYVDYLIADEIALPESMAPFFDEKILRLPVSFQVDGRRAIGALPSRAEAGLPEQGFVFCAFHRFSKITPDIFTVWMRLLSAVPESLLWLQDAGAETQANLRAYAKAHGVAAERLYFAPHAPGMAAHLARLGLADLFLDTLYYNAHATAADALACAVPVLTCPGDSFAGRIAASLVTAMGLPELAVPSLGDYEARGLELARGGAAGIKAKLAQALGDAPLFDARTHARHLERAWRAIWDHQQRGLPPQSFEIPK